MVGAIYARVSTDEQVEHGTSLDEQVRLCREHAISLGALDVVGYIDGGLSGTTMERPQLQALLAAARQKAVDVVVAYDPDRLSRNLSQLLFITDELARLGIRIEFVNFKADVGPDGRLLFSMRGAIAEYEAYRIKQRMYQGKQARAREGKVSGGTTIYGYHYDRATKRWHVDPMEAEVVRRIFGASLDVGTWTIAKQLNDEGIRPRHGRQWQQSTVLSMLRNPTYLGRMPQMGGIGHLEIEAIVSEDLWRRVQRVVDGRLNRSRGRTKHPYLLTGLITCGVCGRHMVGGCGYLTERGYITRYYCGGRREGRCSNRYYRGSLVDDTVWGLIVEVLQKPDLFLETAREATKNQGGIVDDVSDVRLALERLEDERQRLLRAFRKGLIDEDDMASQRKEQEAEERVLRRKVQEVEERQLKRDALQNRIEEIVKQVEESVAWLDTTNHDIRRRVLRQLGITVKLGPDQHLSVSLLGLAEISGVI